MLISGLNCPITEMGARGHVAPRVHQGGSSVSGQKVWRVISWRPGRLDS